MSTTTEYRDLLIEFFSASGISVQETPDRPVSFGDRYLAEHVTRSLKVVAYRTEQLLLTAYTPRGRQFAACSGWSSYW